MSSFPRILSTQAAQVWVLNQQLHDYERASTQRQRVLQAESLRALLKWARSNSAWWRERLSMGGADFLDPWQTLSDLPVLRRTDIQDDLQGLSCVHALAPGSCVLAHSTGSTGQPVKIWKEALPYHLRYLAFTFRTGHWHQLDSRQKLMRVSARVEDQEQGNWGPPEAWFHKTGQLVLTRSLERDVAVIYERLRSFHPRYLTVTASIAHALALHAKEHDAQPPQLSAILTTGETLTDAMRRDCLDAFGAKIINRYTCEEAGWLALQCPKHDHLHVFTANVIVEIVDAEGRPCPPGVPGRVLVTALHSQAMPLIRYEIGDIAEWGGGCDCGINLPVIKRIWGRSRQFIQTPDGRARYIVLVAEDYLWIAPHIRDMRLRYYQNSFARFEIACDSPLLETQRQKLTAKVQELLGFACPVQLIVVPRIDWGDTDKRLGFAVMDGVPPPI